MEKQTLEGYVIAVLELRGEFGGKDKPIIRIKHKDKYVLERCVEILGGCINGPYAVGKYSKSKLYIYNLRGANLDKRYNWIIENINTEFIKDWREKHDDYFLNLIFN